MSEHDQQLTERYRKAAKDKYHDEGTCEVDDNATVSMGDDDGAYVQAWVWVYADELEDAK